MDWGKILVTLGIYFIILGMVKFIIAIIIRKLRK